MKPHSTSHRWSFALTFLGQLAAAVAVNAGVSDNATHPRMLVDFRDPGAVTLQPAQAQAERVAAEGGEALQITTDADASWPGVLIEPTAGPWDLSRFDAVEMDVRNPEDVAVRVLLSVNNPGSDGRHGCNVASVTIKPHGKAVLAVPFGLWHGNPQPLDQKNVVSFRVLLDRPGRAHTFLVSNLRAIGYDASEMEKVFNDRFFKAMKPSLGRGVNLGDMLEAPKEGAWGTTMKAEYFPLIKAAGFDSVRIPVRWSAHAGEAAPYRIEPEFFDRVDFAVHQSLEHGLIPVVDMHHYKELCADPDGQAARFLALWQQIAEHYRNYSPKLVLELLNEPEGKMTADKWNALLAKGIAVVRRSNPTREIVVGPIGWNNIDDLPALELPEDVRHLIVTVHYYNPFSFTHQGAGWVGAESQKWLGTKWNGTPREQHAVMRDLDKAITWAVEHRRPIYLGEFGAYSKGDMDSRARWTRFVAQAALRRKMSFAYWEFCSGFGVYDPQKKQWREPLKQALLAPAN